MSQRITTVAFLATALVTPVEREKTTRLGDGGELVTDGFTEMVLTLLTPVDCVRPKTSHHRLSTLPGSLLQHE